MVCLAIAGLMFLILLGRVIAADELTPLRFRKMVQSDLERTKVENDSIGATLQVMAFGEKARDFMLAPVIRGGKVVAVYKDDPRRNSVTPVANAAVLKSVRADLFTQVGASQYFREKGYTSAEPASISVGPFSLFGVMETGWYLPVGESFVLLSMEGRMANELEVTRYWPDQLGIFREIKERLQPKK